jgi:hypothetical protein
MPHDAHCTGSDAREKPLALLDGRQAIDFRHPFLLQTPIAWEMLGALFRPDMQNNPDASTAEDSQKPPCALGR